MSEAATSVGTGTSQSFQIGIAAVDALSTDLSIPMIGDPNVRNIPRLSDGSAVEQVAFDVDDQSLSTDQDLENTIMDPNTAEQLFVNWNNLSSAFVDIQGHGSNSCLTPRSNLHWVVTMMASMTALCRGNCRLGFIPQSWRKLLTRIL